MMVSLTAGVTAIISIIITHVLTRRREHEDEWRKLKFSQYQEFILALSGNMNGRATPDGQRRYSNAVNSMALIAPKEVFTALRAFQAEVSAAGDTAQKVFSNAGGSPLALSQIDGMLDALKVFRTGGAQEIQESIGKVAQALQAFGVPIDNDMVNKVADGSLPASQYFNKQIKPHVMGMLQSVQDGMGPAKKDETVACLNFIDSQTDPATILGILNKARFAIGLGNDQADQYVDFKNKLAANDPSVAAYKHIGESSFSAYYNRYYDPKRVMQAGLGGAAIPQHVNKGPKKKPTLDTLLRTMREDIHPNHAAVDPKFSFPLFDMPPDERSMRQILRDIMSTN
jgi:hypothetical protein